MIIKKTKTKKLKDKKIETFYCFSGNYEIKKECFYHSNQ